LTIEVERSITSEDVVSTLASLFHSRGQPAFIRSDNGPEFMAKAIKEWMEASKVKTPLHQAGVSLGKRLLGDVHQSLFRRAAKEEVFAALLAAKVLIEDYRDHYNHQRPHSALGYLSPAQFVAAADLGAKEENTGKPEELESVLTLSQHLVQKTGSG